MDAEYHSEPLTQGPAPRVRYGRAFEVQSLEALREAGGDSEGASLLGVATTLNVPEATVRYWSDRSNKVDAAPEVVERDRKSVV